MLNFNQDILKLSKEEYLIYSRHLILNEVGIIGQQRLKQANILFVGAGGLACPAILYLATSGVGSIGIIDSDIVSISNLHRQVLYTRKNINELKTRSIKQKIETINPYCQTKIYSYKLTKNNAADLIKNYDIILDTSDNFDTRYIIDQACNILHKIHIYGAVQNFEGQISVFNYKNGPRYSEIYPKNRSLTINSCNDIGILGIVPGIIGILQATEALKIILGIGTILSGYILIYNALNMSFNKIQLPVTNTRIIVKDQTNIYKMEQTKIILVDELKNQIEYKEQIFIIDVRQSQEFNQYHINNAINIPLQKLKQKKYIQLICKNLTNKTIIIYCSNNSRSIIGSQILNMYKINHYRLKGGLNQWLLIQ
uniref:Probable molybdopterin-synthase adenylyltransferase n=1 Tax=Sarcopeltis skottsbergii TaxID=2765380 RepID=A0A7M3VH47_SARSK|nr:molybdopterin biosynthesis protein [Sarcopeltis skottsbergii]